MRDTKMNLEGMNKNEAITALINEGMDFNAANKYWADNKPEGGTGFKASFYAELEKGIMSEDELDAFIAKADSANILKNRANWLGVMNMANRIWASVE